MVNPSSLPDLLVREIEDTCRVKIDRPNLPVRATLFGTVEVPVGVSLRGTPASCNKAMDLIDSHIGYRAPRLIGCNEVAEVAAQVAELVAAKKISAPAPVVASTSGRGAQPVKAKVPAQVAAQKMSAPASILALDLQSLKAEVPAQVAAKKISTPALVTPSTLGRNLLPERATAGTSASPVQEPEKVDVHLKVLGISLDTAAFGRIPMQPIKHACGVNIDIEHTSSNPNVWVTLTGTAESVEKAKSLIEKYS
eukprot:NODE_14299_length_1117_cov_2.671717.p1 GENE.NODE_14299_length_1117_cov_2.671717~~NODE_14299_length_1117_cov_2.671717.p1  ORF type:complete len:252 (+),score=68.03 NODE_14299_length_1117_cov_2.671717:358-1113(+)